MPLSSEVWGYLPLSDAQSWVEHDAPGPVAIAQASRTPRNSGARTKGLRVLGVSHE